MARLLSRPVSTEDSLSVEDGIRQILAADAAILALGEAARTNTSDALALLRSRMKAHRAYTRTGKP